jgi:hypothetical protein
MNKAIGRKILIGGVVVTLAGLAACAPKVVAPPPAPPPPPVAIVIPPRPYPPLGASTNVTIPAIGLNGTRQTINTGISTAQTIWNVRSAFNVAALNCLKLEHGEILVAYKAFLKTNARGLTNANLSVDREFRAKHGAAFIRPRESYMTQVYNYYAFPPTLPAFCEASLLMARDSLLIKAPELATFSAAQMPRLESVFEQFFRAYEQYRIDAVLWDQRYQPMLAPQPLPAVAAPVAAPAYGTSAPAPVLAPAPIATTVPAGTGR